MADDELVHDDADGVVVGDERVVHPEHDLWRHVPWSSARVRVVADSKYPRNAEIGNVDETLVVEHDVLRLDVSVDHVPRVYVLQRHDYICNYEFWLNSTYLSPLRKRSICIDRGGIGGRPP